VGTGADQRSCRRRRQASCTLSIASAGSKEAPSRRMHAASAAAWHGPPAACCYLRAAEVSIAVTRHSTQTRPRGRAAPCLTCASPGAAGLQWVWHSAAAGTRILLRTSSAHLNVWPMHADISGRRLLLPSCSACRTSCAADPHSIPTRRTARRSECPRVWRHLDVCLSATATGRERRSKGQDRRVSRASPAALLQRHSNAGQGAASCMLQRSLSSLCSGPRFGRTGSRAETATSAAARRAPTSAGAS
jgi:hypothetical protein